MKRLHCLCGAVWTISGAPEFEARLEREFRMQHRGETCGVATPKECERARLRARLNCLVLTELRVKK